MQVNSELRMGSLSIAIGSMFSGKTPACDNDASDARYGRLENNGLHAAWYLLLKAMLSSMKKIRAE